MSDHEHHKHFEHTDAGASDTYPMEVESIKKNDYMVLQGRPCKVVDYITPKPGKIGRPKVSIRGIDIFNGKKYEDVVPLSHNVEVPNIKRTEWTVIACDDEGYLTLMDANGSIRQDLKCPDETEHDNILTERIKAALDEGKEFPVTVMESIKIEKVMEMSEKK